MIKPSFTSLLVLCIITSSSLFLSACSTTNDPLKADQTAALVVNYDCMNNYTCPETIEMNRKLRHEDNMGNFVEELYKKEKRQPLSNIR